MSKIGLVGLIIAICIALIELLIYIHIISEMSIKINQGDIVGIVGPSGSGKSSILNIIGCLYGDFKGDVIINGFESSKLKDYKKTESI